MTPLEPTLHRTLPLNERASQQLDPPLLSSPAAKNPAERSDSDIVQKPTAAPSPSRFVPWLIEPAYPIGRYALIPFYFSHVNVSGRHHLPRTGPVILAPTHRSRWDALLIPYAAGKDITGRHLRFMVSADEVVRLQGWFIRRLGGFPINTKRPAIASLRHGVELLEHSETLVIFPEGNIFRDNVVQPLKPGLARLALQAESSHPNLGVQIVPISIRYSDPMVRWRSAADVQIGEPLRVADFCQGSVKQNAQQLTSSLRDALSNLQDQK